MKKITLFILGLVVLLFPSIVNAASASISVTGPNQVVTGNQLTITVNLSSTTAIGSWQMSLNYDKNYLQLISSNAEAGGTIMAASSATGTKSVSYKFTFKALKNGSTNIGIGSYLAYAFADLSELSIKASSKSIRVLTQAELEASYSKDNNLKSLSVEGYELTPEFYSDVLEYSVVVPEGTKEIVINATKSDNKASITGNGAVEVTEGNNKKEIIVKAENGAEKIYIINVEVKDTNPITVKVNNEEYTVVKVRENLIPPVGSVETTITINDIEIPAYNNEITKFIIIGLKDKNGKISMFIYDNNEYSPYIELTSGHLTILPLKMSVSLKSHTKEIYKIGDNNIEVLSLKEKSRIKIIYGINVLTEEKGLYLYDTKDNTIMKYDSEYPDLLISMNKKLICLTAVFAMSTMILIICMVNIVSKKKKLHDKKESLENKKSKKDNNQIIEKNNPKG